jgi:hypothetical protein
MPFARFTVHHNFEVERQFAGRVKGLQRICGKVAASLRQTFPFGTGNNTCGQL